MASEELATVHELLRGVDLDDLTIAERRAAIESVAAPPPPGTTVEPVDAGGVPAEWVIAAGVDSVRMLLYLHGGAYQIGSPATLRRMIALISAAARVRVLSAGYRLAPEHPFPAAVDDALTAYRFLLNGGADPAAIAIGGDSAGGGLALATLVALRDAGDPLPAAAVAMSPWTDLALTGESVSTRAGVDVMIQPDGMRESAATYLAGADPGHPYASPLYADLHGLPPIPIHVGDAEVILDDSTRFAAKARAAGVDVTLEVWDQMPHVWHAFAGLLPESGQAIERIGGWLQARCPRADRQTRLRWCRLPCEAFQLGGIGRGGRVEDHDADRRVAGHEQGRAVEGQRSGAGMAEALEPAPGTGHVAAVPEPGEVGGEPGQPRGQGGPGQVVEGDGHRRPVGSVKSRCSMFAGPASEYVGSHFWPSPSATSSRCSALWSHGKLAHLGGQRSRTWNGRCCVRYSVDVSYQPMTLADLARLVAAEADFDAQWRLVVEFLKEYHQEPAGVRLGLLEDTPGPVGDERWDVLFAGLAEHLAMRDGQAAPGWSVTRGLRRFWFPFDTPGARAQALVHAPAAFRRRGVFVADYEIDAA